MRLENKTAMVCGGAKGIGKAIALDMAAEGAEVGVVDIDGARSEEVARGISGLSRRALAIEANVTRPSAIKQVVDMFLSEFGRIDILVNNQGALAVDGRVPKGIIAQEEQDWDALCDLNLKSHFLVARAVAPHMIGRRSGKIINISSIGGKTGSTTPVAYAAAKAGVLGLTRALARDLAPYNINVNSICPGIVYTPLWEKYGQLIREQSRRYAGKGPKEIFLEIARKNTLLGREQTPEDIAHAAVFLASEDSRNITGQSLNVDGGCVFD